MPQQNSSTSPKSIALERDGLATLLNYLPRPALLLDGELRILTANRQAQQISGYAENESLTNKLAGALFPALVNAKNAPRTLSNLPPKGIYTILLTQNRQRLPVKLQYQRLKDDPQRCLITFEPAAKSADAGQQGHSGLLQSVKRLFTIPDGDNPLEQIAATCGEWLGSACAAVYLGEADAPVFRKAASWGAAEALPAEIPPADLQYLTETRLWRSAQPAAATILHQAARLAEYAYLASAPLGECGAWNGVLVSAGDALPAQETALPALELLAAATSLYLRQHLQRGNLKNQLAQLTRREAIAQTLRGAISEGVILVSPENEILEINAAAEYILGYAEREIRRQPVENVLIGTDRLEPALKLALQGVPTPNLGKVRLHRRDGSSFSARVQTVPARQGKQILGALVIFQDISEHEQAKIRTQQLEQRALLGEVTAVFAHEVRNPINNISTGLQLMALNAPEEDLETQDLIGRLLGDCNRLTGLMESILTFSRTGNYKFVPLNLEELLTRLIARWRPRLERLNIQHHIQAAPDALPVRGDRRALEQVFTNLISNAVRAMGENGGTLAVKIGPYRSSGGKAFTQVALSDTGPGIPDEVRERIFDPFFTTDPDGTGLGLSITKQIVTAHRGSIYPTSFPGGTVFYVQIPALGATEDFTL